MRELRKLIADKLNEIDGLNYFPKVVDDEMMRKGQVYFSYLLSDRIIDMSWTHQVIINGQLAALQDETDMLNVVDTYAEAIDEKFSELNIKLDMEDVSYDNVIKVNMHGVVYYEEHNKGLGSI